MSPVQKKIQDALEQNKESLFNQLSAALIPSFEDPVYKVVCDACGSTLEHTAKYDADGDVIASVEPCEVCAEEM